MDFIGTSPETSNQIIDSCFLYHSTNVLKMQTFVWIFPKNSRKKQKVIKFFRICAFLCFVHNLFTISCYSNFVLNRRVPQPADLVHTPSSSNPSIRKPSVPQPRVFLFPEKPYKACKTHPAPILPRIAICKFSKSVNQSSPIFCFWGSKEARGQGFLSIYTKIPF